MSEPSRQPVFVEAQAIVRRRSFAGSLDLDTWAAGVDAAHTALRLYDLDDGAVASAAQTARRLAARPPADDELTNAIIGSARDVLEEHGPATLRNLVGITTHLAHADHDLAPATRILLDHTARDLAGTPRRTTDLAGAFREWGDVTQTTAGHWTLHDARSIARMQAMLLNAAVSTQDRILEAQTPPLDRLWEPLVEQRDAWMNTYTSLSREITVRNESRVPSPATAAIAAAGSRLRQSIMDTPDSATLLANAIRSDFGDNVILNALARREGHEGQRSANRLHELGGLLAAGATPITTRPDETQPLPQPVAAADGPSEHPATMHESSGASVQRPVHDSPVVETEPLSEDAAAACARRRDAGSIAQAALHGDSTAVQITRGASNDELKAIAQDGRHAVAELAGSVYLWGMKLNNERRLRDPLVEYHDQGIAMEAVMEAAHTFDPDRSRLSTWTGIVYRGAVNRQRAHESRLSAPLLVPTEPDNFRNVTDSLDTAELALSNESRERIRDALHYLPPKDAVLLKRRFGIDTPAKQVAEIADELGVSHSTVSRRSSRALETLRGIVAERFEEHPEPRSVPPQNPREAAFPRGDEPAASSPAPPNPRDAARPTAGQTAARTTEHPQRIPGEPARGAGIER